MPTVKQRSPRKAKKTPKAKPPTSMATKRTRSPGSLYKAAYLLASKPEPDYDTAAKLLQAAADAEHADAIYALATWYLFGRGPIRKNLKEAARLLRHAAQLGNSDAMYDLAVSYEDGKGVPKNLRQAYIFFRDAAEHGDAKAIFNVGRCLYYGIGIAQDRDEAKKWLDKAEQLGTYVEEPKRRR